MKTSISFSSGPCPTFLVEGKRAGLVHQIDFELGMTHGTINVTKIHVAPDGRFGPFADEQPEVPKHPCIELA